MILRAFPKAALAVLLAAALAVSCTARREPERAAAGLRETPAAVPAADPAPGGRAASSTESASSSPAPAAEPAAVSAPSFPLSADLKEILDSDPASWRHPQWELFAWERIPGVLIFNFVDYGVQARFFGRLGFFVAVRGESGKIEEEAYYEGRHVYNAHDYRPEDLARFFGTAAGTGARLNGQELFLRKVALDNGVLELDPQAPGGLRPGRGAILSISRETPPALRRRLLRHEAAHGIFYAVEEYRRGCARLWESLSAEEREFWILFLSNKGRLDGRSGYDGYDTGNLYLTVNEMQAHVVQLDRGEVDPYFRETYLPRLARLLPDHAGALQDFMTARPASFRDLRRGLEELLERSPGIPGGDLYAAGSAGAGGP